MATEKMVRGDSETLYADVQINGFPLDVSAYSVWFTAKYLLSDPDSSAVIRKGNSGGLTGCSVVANPVSGEMSRIRIDIDPGDTSALPAKSIKLFMDVQIKSPLGRVTTVCRGELNIEPDSTNSIV